MTSIFVGIAKSEARFKKNCKIEEIRIEIISF